MVWFFSTYPKLTLKLNRKNPIQKVFICYTPIFLIIFKFFVLKSWKQHILISKYILAKKFFLSTFETKIVRLKYIGKIFRITKKKKIFFLSLNYSTFKYLIWKNIKMRRRKKPKRFIFIFILTNISLKTMFWKNLIKLRPLNTYTGRGVYSNVFSYNQRKRKLTAHR